MRFPFSDEFNDLFRQDHSIWWKMVAGAVAGVILTIIAFRDHGKFDVDGETIIVMLSSAVTGVVAAILLSLKDVVDRRIAAGQPVSWLLRLYFGSGLASLILWGVTAFAIAFPTVVILFGYVL